MTVPANDPKRATREEEVEAGFCCRECSRCWFIVSFEGEPPANHNVCVYCGAGDARRVR